MHSRLWKFVAIASILLHFCFSIEEDSYVSMQDQISKLPGQPQVNFQQFSGYISVDKMNRRSLFYYFAEAETDPSTKPLVLWLNGGPGCSSVGVGAFSENGPFRPSGKLLVKNEHSWNKEANMLYLETPAGVGFSYSSDSNYYSGVGDEMTSRDNLVFLQRWFNKFPQYKHRDLYISGESYAGHYIPQLANLIVQFNKKEKIFNLKGIALGNPVLEFATDFNSRAEYFWSHGLISDSTYNIFTSVCNYSRYVSEYYRDSLSPICERVMSQVTRETSRFVDKYDVTLDVCISSVLSQSLVLLSPQQAVERIDVCVEDETVNYLNRKDVQEALHAQLIGVNRWTVCSSVLEYKLLDLEIPTITVVGSLIKSGIPVLVYSGDQDSVIPLTGSRTLVQKLAKPTHTYKTTIQHTYYINGSLLRYHLHTPGSSHSIHGCTTHRKRNHLWGSDIFFVAMRSVHYGQRSDYSCLLCWSEELELKGVHPCRSPGGMLLS